MFNLQLSENICLTIYAGKANKLVLGIMLLFALSIFLIPIAVFLFLVIIDEGLSFGFIITCVISLLSSGYLIRLYLWNKNGKEVFIIQRDNLVLYYDYKLFKDNHQKFHFNSIQVYFDHNGVLVNASQRINNPTENENINSIIYFDLDGKNIKSEGEIPIETIIDIAQHIKHWKQ